MKKWLLLIAIGFLVAIAIAWVTCLEPPAKSKTTYLVKNRGNPATGGEPISPIPLNIDLDSRKVALGKLLFHDTRLSRDDSISCAHCHDLANGGMDGLPRSIGVDGREGVINAPTVFNSGLNFKQFWDGRADTLEEQIDGPISNKNEMDSSWDEIIGKLARDNELKALFRASYKDGITADNIKNAIATFERSLITPNAPFDRFLRGEKGAITDQAKQGYILFKQYGCIACHQGMNIGGNMFHALGDIDDHFKDKQKMTTADLGRFNVTGDEDDKYVFRVPSLRNVAITSPYFHDSHAESLEKAVEEMAKDQLMRNIPKEHMRLIVEFLESLTGEYKGEPLK